MTLHRNFSDALLDSGAQSTHPSTPLHPDVQQLLSIQEVDQRIAAVRKDLDSVPRERDQREAKLAVLRAALAGAGAASTESELAVRSNQLGLEQGDQEIKKLQERLNVVKNNAEYQAILLQVESVKKQINETEEEGLGLLEAVEAARAALVEAKTAVEAEDKVFAEFMTEANKILTDRGSQVAVLEAEREQHLGAVPPELLSEYERMFGVRGNLAVCPIEGETCTGCYMSVPPNLQVKVRASSAVVRCDSCQRILYYAD